MGDLVLRALEDATAAVASRNRRLAYQVVLLDNRIDVLEGSIDRLCQEFLVRHMPAAGLLRFVLAVAKVNSELERIGDYAEAIARRAVTLGGYGEIPEKERIFEMARIAIQALRQAVQSFLAGDADQAATTFSFDRQVDEMHSTIFRALAHPSAQEQDLTARFALLGLVTRLERVADRACNVAEETIYVVRGQVLRHMPRYDIRILFLCEHNHCRSQMAEAIARHIAPASFVFQSAAGQDPQELDPGAVQFMAGQGLDISRQRSKVLADVGEVGDFNVVVTLSQGGEQACPALPYAAIALNWEIEDPSKATGSPEEIKAAYERVYEDLRAKIAELVEGMLGAQAEPEEKE
jgi:phosphate transport system protein